MPEASSMNGSRDRRAYTVTGPTSGLGRATALELAKGTISLTYHGTTDRDAGDRPATPTDEIELTSLMMAAGIKTFWSCSRGPSDLDTGESAVYAIFMAMMEASAKYHIRDMSDQV